MCFFVYLNTTQFMIRFIHTSKALTEEEKNVSNRVLFKSAFYRFDIIDLLHCIIFR